MSGQKWITEERGIRYYEHESRMHGKRRDRYYTIRHTVNGKQVQEALGWLSEGWTLTKVRLRLAEIQEAKRTGQGATSLKETRSIAKKEKKTKSCGRSKSSSSSDKSLRLLGADVLQKPPS